MIHALKLFSCLVVLRFKKILETLTFTRRMIRKTSLPLQSWWSIDSSSAMAPAPLQRKYSYWRQTDARERSGADLTSTLPLMIIMIIIIPTTMFMVRIERWTVLKKICTEQWGFKIRHQSADECHPRTSQPQSVDTAATTTETSFVMSVWLFLIFQYLPLWAAKRSGRLFYTASLCLFVNNFTQKLRFHLYENFTHRYFFGQGRCH